jgi:hypothetical protein
MRRISLQGRALTLFSTLVATAAFLAADAGQISAQTKDQKKRDADVNRYFKQLQSRFTSWDLDGDGTLDKGELAKAFRGADAKPYDYVPEPKLSPPTPERELVTTISWVLIGLPMSAQPVNLTLVEIVDLQAPRQVTVASAPVNFNLLPDYQFLVLAGTKGQSRLSRQEFETWARSYAGSNADQDQAQRHLTTAQNKFQKAKTNKAKQAAQLEVQRAQQDYQQATAQINAVPITIRATLGLKR